MPRRFTARAARTLLGIVGPAARASGIDLDARRDVPSGLYRERRPETALQQTGDVFARVQQRWREIENSIAFLMDVLEDPGGGSTALSTGPLAPDAIAVSLVEGWRGEIVHVAATYANGRFVHYKTVDPSFRDWFTRCPCATRASIFRIAVIICSGVTISGVG